MSLPSGTTLGSYRITALLGAGGMGEVYRAHDANLGRDVAIKVLPESLVKDAEALARFEREARAVAALSHPNIRGIFDLVRGDAHGGGFVFAVMELLEGEPLRTKLLDGPLPQKLALDWALQVARGLSAAHEKGIVHRDIKPENVFVTKDGFVKILDFGLAKQQVAPFAPFAAFANVETSGPTTPASPNHHASGTEPGVVLGTFAYMSPEQARGQAVDHRSDIFSFGSMLHEMLTGRKAFQRETALDTMAAIARDEPALAAAAKFVTPALLELVRHCLEKKPEDRFQSVKDVAYGLGQIASGSSRSVATAPAIIEAAPPAPRKKPLVVAAAGIAIALGVVSIVALVALRHPAPSVGSDAKRRIAVLPFENLGAVDQEYFADGVTDEVRGKLTALPTLEVIARSSSTPFKKTDKTPNQIAKELNVTFLLTGTIRWERVGGGGRVQVRPELVEVKASGAPASRWQQHFEAELTDVFRVQSDIATRVASELGVALGGAEVKKLAEGPTSNLLAYDRFLRGEEAWAAGSRTDGPSIKLASEHFEGAVILDPSFALAWACLSRARSLLYTNWTASPELAAAAKQAAEKAVALAPGAAESHIALGTYERNVTRDVRRALDAFEEARRLEPSNPRALGACAVANRELGRWELGVQQLQEVIRMDPLATGNRLNLGRALLFLRRLDEARRQFDQVLAVAPTNHAAILGRAMVSVAESDLAGARDVLRRVPKEMDSRGLVAYFTRTYELWWMLETEQREVVPHLTPAEFGDDKGAWGLCLALSLPGDDPRARELIAQSVDGYRRQIAGAPEDATSHSLLGLALALSGRKDEAVREGLRGTEIQPVEKHAVNGPYYRHVLSRIYILTGEHQKALDVLEPLLQIPYFLTPGWLSVDPTFDPLRSNPRFQKLVAGGR